MKHLFKILICVLAFSFTGMAQLPVSPLPSKPNKNLLKKEVVLKLGNKSVKVLFYQRGEDNGIIYFNMHDNENTCVKATKQMIDKLGQGKFVELSHGGNRLISFYLKGVLYRVDPNRIFTPVGIEKTLRIYGNYSKDAQKEVERFSTQLIKLVVTGNKFVVAMHNNSNLKTFTVKHFHPKTGVFRKDAKAINYNHKMCAGDFYYILDEGHYRHLTRKGFSAVLQNPDTYVNDGSLSTYCTQQGIPYINVEAYKGNLEPQLQMLDALQDVLKPYMKK